jgi:hypothetical protein
MDKTQLTKEYNDLISEANKQPGVSELMKVYGNYDEMLKQSHEYLEGYKTKSKILTSSNSSS